MALKGYIWAVLTALSFLIAVLVVVVLLLLAQYFEHHQQHVQAADGLNYGLAAAAGYFLADPENEPIGTPEEIDD